MSCLCQKLLTEQYSSITESEAELLKRTKTEAPHLFQVAPRTPPDVVSGAVQVPRKRSAPGSASPDVVNPAAQASKKRSAPASAPRPRKHPRTLSGSSPTSDSLNLDRPQGQLSEATHIQVPPSTATATRLEKTYSYRGAAILLEKGNQLNIQQGDGIYLRIFRAIQQADQFQRICFYALAKLHRKGTSVNHIVKEIQDALPAEDTERVYKILHIGNKWVAIIDLFASIVEKPCQQLTGFLCLFESPSAWERAATEDCRLALYNLYKTTDLYQRILEVTPFVSKILNQLLGQYSFIDETPSISRSFGTMAVSQSLRSSHEPSVTSETEPIWRAPSMVAVSEAIPRPIRSEDAKILLVLLSFLSTSEKVPLDLLFRGATSRRRWTVQGEIEEVDALRVGLAPELGSLLSDIQRLGSAFHELELLSAVSKNSDEIYTLDEDVAHSVRGHLSSEHPFWRSQALIIAYRAIPWKYLESTTPDTLLFLPHLKHALRAFQDGFEQLPLSTRVDLVLTLIETTRFPNMSWKRFVVGQAEVAARGLEDYYLQSCIAQSQCLLYRITGDMDRAASSLDSLDQSRPSNMADQRIHLATGQAIIQQSLNCIQVENLSAAEGLLGNWETLYQRPSPMEEVMLLRKDMMLGRVLRLQGKFAESLMHLETARKTAERCGDLIFDEDLRDLTCDLADTLRELDNLVPAEQHLRAEIGRRDQICTTSSGRSLLELSLAEVLFAQGRLEEAEGLCSDIQSRPGLLKVEKLRLYITLAKIRHICSDNEGALSRWGEALKAIGKFPMTNGRTTRIIVMSICDTLRCLGHTWLVRDSLKEVATLDELAKPGGVQYWIAGMRHWLEYLQSRDNSLRSRI